MKDYRKYKIIIIILGFIFIVFGMNGKLKDSWLSTKDYHEGNVGLIGEYNKKIPESSIDLDSIQNDVFDENKGDITFVITGGSSIFFILMPENGATAYIPADNKNTKQSCLENKKSFSNRNIPEITSNIEICILTNDGRIAIVKNRFGKISLINENQFYLELEYRIWD